MNSSGTRIQNGEVFAGKRVRSIRFMKELQKAYRKNLADTIKMATCKRLWHITGRRNGRGIIGRVDRLQEETVGKG